MTAPSVRVHRSIAIVAAAIALMIMFLPTWPVTWALSYGTFLTTHHAWWDPILIGYAMVAAPLSLLLALVGGALSVSALVRPRQQRSPAWLFGIAAVVGILGVILFSGSTEPSWTWLAIEALIVGSGASVLAVRQGQPRPRPVSDRPVPAPR